MQRRNEILDNDSIHEIEFLTIFKDYVARDC